jgi:hypothetical protein
MSAQVKTTFRGLGDPLSAERRVKQLAEAKIDQDTQLPDGLWDAVRLSREA